MYILPILVPGTLFEATSRKGEGRGVVVGRSAKEGILEKQGDNQCLLRNGLVTPVACIIKIF